MLRAVPESRWTYWSRTRRNTSCKWWICPVCVFVMLTCISGFKVTPDTRHDTWHFTWLNQGLFHISYWFGLTFHGFNLTPDMASGMPSDTYGLFWVSLIFVFLNISEIQSLICHDSRHEIWHDVCHAIWNDTWHDICFNWVYFVLVWLEISWIQLTPDMTSELPSDMIAIMTHDMTSALTNDMTSDMTSDMTPDLTTDMIPDMRNDMTPGLVMQIKFWLIFM